MPENRNDDAGQSAGGPDGFAAPGQPSSEPTPAGQPDSSTPASGDAAPAGSTPASDTAAIGGAPTQPLYGQYGEPTPEQASSDQPASGQQPYGQTPQQAPYEQQPYGQQPPYGQQQPYAQQQPYGQQPPYGTNYGYPGTYQAPAQKPGKALGIGGLVLSCLFFIPYASLAGLILSIVGLVQSRKANERNGPALAGIIIGAIVFLLTLLATILIFVFAAGAVVNVVEVCAEYGTGTHVVDGMTYECNVNSTGFEQSL
ncbi:hypothetical protein H9638_15550 [Arthrobacter sp. Sa2BUA2]|uniref:DUF4190 domain-containing protein n=1 Tax=Arthrobacter pullicola TaxID=2762224 RepID=A0ABR8YLU4_9MICC|nr:hypothetical protein [Arthrobacter pullicola]MBD8045225.1 hypothetical protein [Arthrobacter pullicola]